MIPYFAQPQIGLGPVTIHAFGILVACALVVGMRIVRRRAVAHGLADLAVGRFLTWVLVGGFAGAHLVDRLIYFPMETIADPLSVLRFWESLSSFGGFLGGTVGAVLFFRRHAVPGTVWLYIDSFAYAFPFGWIFGRAGCFVAYDHPGRPTRFVLGELYKDGIVRHNLGLEEAIYTGIIVVLFYVLGRRPRFPGFFLGLFMLLYAPFRFSVDFLRIVDVRHDGLTPAQYGCIVLALAGIAILSTRRRVVAASENLFGRQPHRTASPGAHPDRP